MIVNVINLSHRVDRRKSATEELDKQGASYLFWDGIMTKERRIGIALAHKQIIRDAQRRRLPMVLVAEDDIKFTHPQALKYFLQNIPKDFDLYLSSYYSGYADEKFEIKKFNGLTMYICAERYYETFLSASEKHHLDNAIGMMGGKFIVCPKFVCYQMNGYSDQRRRFCNDSNRIKGRPMYDGS